jgi:diguanylate cyclase (GGDEF)-like protein/PAS domain S-box-containing protein
MDVYKSVTSPGISDQVGLTTPRVAPKAVAPEAGFSTLRTKTLLIILAVTVGLLVALVIPLYTIILNSFVQLEDSTVRTDVSRGLSALDAKMDTMAGTALNWSASDETYDYARYHNPSYLTIDLPESIFDSLRINVFALYDTSGKLILGRAYDYENDRTLEFPEYFQCPNNSCSKLLAQSDPAGSLKGLVQLPQGPMMIVSLPVVNSKQQGPIRGTLLMGRFLSQSEIDRLSKTTSLNLTFQSVQQYNASTLAGTVDTRPGGNGATTGVRPIDEQIIVGSTVLNDVNGQPLLVMSVTSSRAIYDQGKNSVIFFILALLTTGLVFSVLNVALFERVVLSRLSRLSARVVQIGAEGDPSARVSVKGNDELSRLADSINGTLAALERSHHAHRDSEANYRVVVEQTNEAIFLVDAISGQLVEANAAFRDLLGYELDDVPTLSIGEVVAVGSKTLDLMLTRILSTKRLIVDEVRLRRNDGTQVEVAVNASYIEREAGDVLCFVAHDLTERKRAEEERAMHLSEERFRSLVQNAADIISIVNPDGTIRYQSPSVENILGYSADNMVGTSIFSYLHPDDAEMVHHSLSLLFTEPSNAQRALLRARHVDGTWRHLEAIGANLLHDPNVNGLLLNIRDITERKELEDRLTHQAFHDPLTGLPNRMFFNNRLQIAVDTARRRDTNIAVVFLDLDNFKLINDSLGHPAGDKLLVEVGQRLRAAVRLTDTVARFGGDEFTFLFESDVTEESVIQAVERVQATLAETLTVDGHDLSVAASIGVVVSTPEVLYPEELLRSADIALYRAKRNGKSRYAIYHSHMNVDAMSRLQLEIDLRRAIERNELFLYYQPLVELTTGKVTGVEALMRWRHPERGIIVPNDFIPIAEENGMIMQIGQWALEEACQQVRVWQTDPAITPTLTVSVNVSARQFQEPELVDIVTRVLRESNLEPRFLKLEITESIGMDDSEMTLVLLKKLKELGVGIALDDFGMGHSALSYLKRFPIDTLKLDRLFVSGLPDNKEDRAIVLAAVGVARAMGLDITAEGVETKEQIQILYSLGCDHGQGFYFARPMPAFAMETYLKVKRVTLQDASTRELTETLHDSSTQRLTDPSLKLEVRT